MPAAGERRELSPPIELTSTEGSVARSPAAAAEPRLRDGVGYAVRVFAAVWIGWALLGLLGVGLVPPGQPPVSVPGLAAAPLTPGWHNLVTAGDRGDALWYQRIAAGGYRTDDPSAAFFPLYPLAIRLLAALPGVGPLAAATVLAQGSFLAALVVLYALTTRELGPDVGRRATRYLAVFPTAFFFLAPYTESPFLLLSLLAFWYARRDRWSSAAVAGALAALTRSVGVVLLPALLVEAFSQWRASGQRLVPRLAAATAPLLGLAGYGVYWSVAKHDPLAPLTAQHNWQRQLSLPTTTLWQATAYAWRYGSYWLIDLLVAGVVIVALVAVARRLRASYLTYGLVSLLLPLSEPFPDRPLLSLPRFVAVIFPAFWGLAVVGGRRRLPEPLVVGVFAGGYALLGLLFTNYYAIF